MESYGRGKRGDRKNREGDRELRKVGVGEKKRNGKERRRGRGRKGGGEGKASPYLFC